MQIPIDTKWVNGYEGRYSVSPDGSVFSWTNRSMGKALVPRNANHGYQQVALFRDGKRKEIYVHRIVAEAFCPKGGREVNHKNGVKNDNRSSNLEWVTRSENITHASRTGLWKRKLSDEEILKIKRSAAPASGMAAMLGVSKTTIYSARNGRLYAWI